MQAFAKIYQRNAFFPGWIGVFINPFYLARAGLRDAVSGMASKLDGKLLDVGCGKKPYQRLFDVDSYTGLDIDSEVTRKHNIADHFYDGHSFPFQDAEYDSILCNQVLEHVFSPDEFLGEINRVLKPGGRLLLTVPFVWDEHEQPYDYARYSSFGLRALLEKNGFKIIKHQKIGANASIIFQLINAYLYKITISFPEIFRVLMIISIMAFFNLSGILFARLLPENPDFYLDHVVLAEKAI